MVLVTGGTGLVGSHLLLQLVQDKEIVRATYRDGSNLDDVLKVFNYYSDKATELFNSIEWVKADILDIPALEVAFKNITYVYHTAALISFDPNDYIKLKTANVTGTTNIVNLCLLNKIAKLCYVSTIGAIGKSSPGVKATEDNEWSSQDANVYALTKYRAEMEVWRGSQEGLQVVIVNPGVIIGPGFWDSGSGNLFTTAEKSSRYYPPGGTGFIGVDDVIKMMLSLMRSTIINERFIAVSNNHTFKEILDNLSTKLNKKGPSIMLKLWQLRIARFIDYILTLITKRKRKITKKTIVSLMNPEVYDNKKIIKAVNFEFNQLDDIIEFSCQRFIEER